MNGLLLHCGASAVSRAELLAMPEPKPIGPRHQPVHHGDFVEMIDRALEDNGLTVVEEAFGMTRQGNRFFGTMRVTGRDVVTTDEHGFVIGMRGAHDMSLDRAIGGGSHVFVCDNLAMNADSLLRTRQTTNIHDRLPAMIDGIIRNVSGWSTRVAEQFEAYKGAMLTARAADALLTGMVRRGIIMPSEMGKLIKEWDEPSHECFAEEPNVWRAFNAATEVLKPRNPETPRLATLAPKTVNLHNLCDEFAGIDLLN